MPYKANDARRHRIPRARYKATNWPEYDRALRQRGSLMDQSSGCFAARLQGRLGMNDSAERVHAASCEGDAGEILASELTGSEHGGASQVGPLLEQTLGRTGKSGQSPIQKRLAYESFPKHSAMPFEVAFKIPGCYSMTAPIDQHLELP